MRLTLWHVVQAAFTLACMGPGGSGLPGALGACALAKAMAVDRKISVHIRRNTQESPGSVLKSQNWIAVGRGTILFLQDRRNHKKAPTDFDGGQGSCGEQTARPRSPPI